MGESITGTAYLRDARRSFLSLSPSVENHGTDGIVSPERYVEALTQGPVCYLNWESGLCGYNLAKTKSSSCDRGPLRRGKYTHRHIGRGSVMTEAETGGYVVTKLGPQRAPPTTRSQKRHEGNSVEVRGKWPCQHLGFRLLPPGL